MKRSTDTRRSPAEIKADLQSHYGGLADKKPDGHAARQFVHKAYQNYSVRDGDENEQKGQVSRMRALDVVGYPRECERYKY